MERRTLIFKPFPISLNTIDNPRTLPSGDCVKNRNIIRMANGDIRAHYRFDTIQSGTYKKFYYGQKVFLPPVNEQVLLYGVDENYGSICSMKKGTTTINEVITNYNKNIIPCIVPFKEFVYFFGGYHPDYVYAPRYDGEKIENSILPHARVACLFRGRIFMAGIWGEYPGILKFTDPGMESMGALNFYHIGNIREPITALWALSDRIVIGKQNEIWELVYTSDTIIDAILRKRSGQAGILDQYAARRYFETLFFYDLQGAYLLNPEKINIASKGGSQILEVDPGIAYISRPVRNIFQSFNYRDNTYTTVFKRTETDFPSDDYYWKNDDFAYMGNTKLGLNNFTLPKGRGVTLNNTSEPNGIAYLQPIYLPEDQQWLLLEGWGWTEEFADYIKVWVTTDPSTVPWRQVSQTNVQVKRINFKQEIWSDWKDATKLHIRIMLYGVNPNKPPYFHGLTLYSAPVTGSYFGAGRFRDTFYIFGEDSNNNRINLGYQNGDWFKYDTDNKIYNLINETEWAQTYNLVGCGENLGDGEAAVFTIPIPESESGVMNTELEIGEIDYDLPDIPKRLRKLFITYKGSNILLYLYGENWSKVITLADKTNFGTTEINIQSPRSKWHKYKLIAGSADFIVRELKVEIKIHQSRGEGGLGGQ